MKKRETEKEEKRALAKAGGKVTPISGITQ